jgi:Na+/melibiose symporter-like transporter
VFLVNVPVVTVALIAGWRLVPTSKDPGGHAFDPPGAALSILGIGALVYAIIEAPRHGWISAPTIAGFALAAVALLAFAWRELTARSPMLDLHLFRDARFSVSSGGIALAFFTMFGMFFVLTQYLQQVLGYSPFEAGLVILPMSATLMLLAPRAPRLVVRFGIRTVVPCGLLVVAAGLLTLTTVSTDSPLWRVYLLLIPLAAGMAVTTSPLTTLIMSSVPPGRAGVGSAMNDTTRELGGALGVAVLGSLVSTGFVSAINPALRGLPDDVRAEARTGIGGALHAAQQLGGDSGAALARSAKSAYVDGMSLAAAVGVVVVAATALAARLLLPRRVRAVANDELVPVAATLADEELTTA